MNSIKISSSLKRMGVSLLLAGALSSVAMATTPTKEVSDQAKKALTTAFPKAESVKWMESENGEVCTAYFWLYDVKTVAAYNRNGDLINILRYYKEDHLPAGVLAKLKGKYADKTIAGVTELTDAEQNISYFVKLEDAKHWYTVKISDDGMEQTEKLNKQ